MDIKFLLLLAVGFGVAVVGVGVAVVGFGCTDLSVEDRVVSVDINCISL